MDSHIIISFRLWCHLQPEKVWNHWNNLNNTPKICGRWVGLVTYTYLLIILHLFHPQSQHQSSHKKSTYDSDIWRARGSPTKPRSQTHKPSPAQTTDKYRQFVSTVVILVFRLASPIFIRTAAVILVFHSTAIFISTAAILVFLLGATKISTLSWAVLLQGWSENFCWNLGLWIGCGHGWWTWTP